MKNELWLWVRALSVVPHFSLAPPHVAFSRGGDFTRARLLLALLSLRKNGGLLLVYACVGGYKKFGFAVIPQCGVNILS